jgi:hypothetical protein
MYTVYLEDGLPGIIYSRLGLAMCFTNDSKGFLLSELVDCAGVIETGVDDPIKTSYSGIVI